MNQFIYQYPVKQYFGNGCAEETLKNEMKSVGTNVMLAFGNSSLKKTGLYDKIVSWLKECGKNVTDFGGIMPNPTYAKVQEGAQLVRKHQIDFILAVGAYTDCNHGQGLAVIHPALYRHLLDAGEEKLACMAEASYSKLIPVFVFIMLFVTFCKVSPREMKFRLWHLWLVIFQLALCLSIGLLLYF